MMICPHCQKENINLGAANICTHCNKPLYVPMEEVTTTQKPTQPVSTQPVSTQPVVYCSTCGNPCHANAAVCLKCGSALNGVKGNKAEVDEVVPALKWISFFIPLVGLILYITKVQSAPNSAREYGKMALIGFGVTFALIAVPIIFDNILYIF